MRYVISWNCIRINHKINKKASCINEISKICHLMHNFAISLMEPKSDRLLGKMKEIVENAMKINIIG